MQLLTPRRPEFARFLWQSVAYVGVVVVLVAAAKARGDDELDPVDILRRWDEGEGPPPSGIDHEQWKDTRQDWSES